MFRYEIKEQTWWAKQQELESNISTLQTQNQELLKKFTESMEMLKHIKTKEAEVNNKVMNEKENINMNIPPTSKPPPVPEKKENSDAMLEEINKLRNEFKELSMSVRESKKESPQLKTTIKKEDKAKKSKKGIKAMFKGAESSDEDQSNNNRLSSDDEETEQEIKSKNKKSKNRQRSKRKDSSGRFTSFRSKKKLRSRSKHLNSSDNHSSDNSDSDEYTRPSKVKKQKSQKIKNNKQKNIKDPLSESQVKYSKVAEQAINELAQFTSEDEDLIRLRKREHFTNSVKKEKALKSQRLESMLKNAALNNDESIEMTPSSQNMSRVIPEKHPYPYQPPMDYSMMQNQGFYPEATFAAQNHPFNQNPVNHKSFNQEMHSSMAFNQHPGYNMPQYQQFPPSHSYMHSSYDMHTSQNMRNNLSKP